MSKTLHTMSFYMEHEEQFFGRRGTLNLVREMAAKMSGLDREAFSDEHWKIIELTFAKQIADEATAQLLEEKKLYTKVRQNSGCLGYTNKSQEAKEAYRIVTTFEYNCCKLSLFKKQYNLD